MQSGSVMKDGGQSDSSSALAVVRSIRKGEIMEQLLKAQPGWKKDGLGLSGLTHGSVQMLSRAASRIERNEEQAGRHATTHPQQASIHRRLELGSPANESSWAASSLGVPPWIGSLVIKAPTTGEEDQYYGWFGDTSYVSADGAASLKGLKVVVQDKYDATGDAACGFISIGDPDTTQDGLIFTFKGGTWKASWVDKETGNQECVLFMQDVDNSAATLNAGELELVDDITSTTKSVVSISAVESSTDGSYPKIDISNAAGHSASVNLKDGPQVYLWDGSSSINVNIKEAPQIELKGDNKILLEESGPTIELDKGSESATLTIEGGPKLYLDDGSQSININVEGAPEITLDCGGSASISLDFNGDGTAGAELVIGKAVLSDGDLDLGDSGSIEIGADGEIDVGDTIIKDGDIKLGDSGSIEIGSDGEVDVGDSKLESGSITVDGVKFTAEDAQWCDAGGNVVYGQLLVHL